MYDISSRDTYNALANWLTDARTLASPDIVIVLVGNKKDLEADREVTFLEASRFAQENELMFLETSARQVTTLSLLPTACAQRSWWGRRRPKRPVWRGRRRRRRALFSSGTLLALLC